MKTLLKIELITVTVWLLLAAGFYYTGQPYVLVLVAAFLQARVAFNQYSIDKLAERRDRLLFRLSYYEQQLNVLVKEVNELNSDIEAIVDARAKGDQ